MANTGLIRMLTDRGTEYCVPDAHDNQLYLTFRDIEHMKTKVRHPQINGIRERTYKIILQEFCQVTFRRTIYRTIEIV